MSAKYSYGECALCGYVGTVTKHHAIPKRLRITTSRKAKLYHPDEKGLTLVPVQTSNFMRIEHIQVLLCKECHQKVHPENYVYQLSEFFDLKKRFAEGLAQVPEGEIKKHLQAIYDGLFNTDGKRTQ